MKRQAFTARRGLAALVYVITALLGAWYGFDFGARLGGFLVGLLTAFNGALFCTIMISALVERLLPPAAAPASQACEVSQVETAGKSG